MNTLIDEITAHLEGSTALLTVALMEAREHDNKAFVARLEMRIRINQAAIAKVRGAH